jgi:hypothetical protein
VFAPTAVADSGSTFQVRVQNVAGVATSRVATLTVQPPPQAPTIVGEPADLLVTAPAEARFEVAAAGDAPLYYQWRRDGAAVTGEVASAFTLSPTAVSDDGAAFEVVVSNAAGVVTSRVATLNVSASDQPPQITDQPDALAVRSPAAAAFSVAAAGTSPLAYQWRRNGTPIAGATGAGYELSPTSVADNGAVFDVVVSNAAGTAVSDGAALTVLPPELPPEITIQPADRSVYTPASATFYVVAMGAPPLTYRWRRDGTPMAGATASSYLLGATTTADDGAQFDVVVTNPGGAVTSRVATLTARPVPVPPTLTLQPADVTVKEPDPATFAAAATGDQPLHVQWWRDGSPVAGATGTTLVVENTGLADHGAQVHVVVSNAAGTVQSRTATLTVLDTFHAWRRPTLSWEAVPGATWYRIWIERNGTRYYRKWLNQADTSWTPDWDLPAGNYRWWVRGWVPETGRTPWVGPNTFALTSAVPGVVTTLLPEGSAAGLQPDFTWQADVNAFWYQVLIHRGRRLYHKKWVPWQQLEYRTPLPMRLGRYRWWVRGWSPDGYGPWSEPRTFYIGRSVPRAPVGVVNHERRPWFVWDAVESALWYQVWVHKEGKFFKTYWVEGGTTWRPSEDLESGDYRWWVRSWNAAAYGPWSQEADFTIPVAVPGVITGLSPTGTVAYGFVEYRWRRDPDATWYRLVVHEEGEPFHAKWYPAGESDDDYSLILTGHGAGLNYTWWVRGYSPDGEGPWNEGIDFTTTTP